MSFKDRTIAKTANAARNHKSFISSYKIGRFGSTNITLSVTKISCEIQRLIEVNARAISATKRYKTFLRNFVRAIFDSPINFNQFPIIKTLQLEDDAGMVFPDGRAIPSPWARGPLMVTAATAILAGA